MKYKFMNKKLAKSNLFEYFYYFIILSIIITVMLGCSLYFYFSSLLRNETIESNNNILAQLKAAQEVILTEVDNSMAQIVMDPFFYNYENYYQSNDVLIQRAVSEKLENTLAINKYIDSIYFYYYGSNLILSSKVGNTTSDIFYDNKFLFQILESNIKGNFVESRNMPEYRNESSNEVLSLIKPLPIVFTNKPSAIMVVNIKSQYLQQTISYINTKKDSSVFIYDDEGKVVSKHKETAPLREDEILNLLPEEKNLTNGHYVRKLNGENILVSFVKSEKYNWRYVYVIPMSTITSRIDFLGTATLLLSLLAIILGALGSVFFSNRIYLPIKATLSLFSGNKLNEIKGESIREVEMLQRNIHGLIDHNQDLETIMKDYRVYDKNKFLQDWITGNYPIDEHMLQRLEYYNIELNIEGYYAAYIISMDNYKEFRNDYTERQQNMLFAYTKENINNTVFNECKGFIVETSRNEIVVIVNFPLKAEINDVKTIAYTLARNLHALITENIKYTFTVAVSGVHYGISEISDCYTEGISTLNYKIILGHNQVILFENVESTNGVRISYPFAIEKNILNNMRVGNRDDVLNSLDEFVEYISQNLTENIEYVRYYFLQLISTSIKCAHEIDINVDDIFAMQKNIYDILIREETMQGMLSCTAEFYEAVLAFLDEKRLGKNKDLINLMTEYINNNLGSDLSIEGIAENFYISSSYLRKIFKDETGETIKSYINNLRMEKAKQMLKEPDIKISDISENVGYLSAQAFTKAFKFYIGKTPGEYRNQEVLKSISVADKL